MIENSINLGVPRIVGPADIVSANEKINTLFVAYIFNTKHGLEDLTEEEYAAAAMLDDDIEGAREERAFRMWINSLGIEGVYIDNNLFDECKDGILLCKIINKLDDKVVDWKKVDMKPKNDFGRNINNGQAIDAAKKMGLKLISVGGVDITKGERTPILALVWQLVRKHYLHLIGDKSEDDLVKWANELVGGKTQSITSFKDKSLCSSVYFIHLCAAIETRAVNWDIVTEGANEDDAKMNAKYAISIARRLGAVIFCVWEDFVNVNPKQMLIFFATMNEIQAELAANKE
jgi:plastin-1